MRSNKNRIERTAFEADFDPRDRQGADIIDLTTRNVLPAVSQRRGRSDGLGLAAGITIVMALGALTLWSMDSARSVKSASPQTNQAVQPVPPIKLSPLDARPGTPMAMMPQPGAALAAPAPQAVMAMPPQTSPGQAPATNGLAAPTIVFDASAMPAPAVAGASGAAAIGVGGDDFANRIGGIGGGAATAKAMVDPKTTVTQGTLIPAVLETAINTDVPGYTRAVVSADVRSFDGSRVLIPRSSRLIGQYKSGLQAGQKRAYVIWTRLIRPDGVSVNIASPAIAFSGETGLSGSVDSHFFARFGSAMMLSVIGGLSTLGGGGASAVITGGGQSAAAAAVGQNGQIGPTVRVHQGEPLRVFTARDLEFSKVEAQ